MYNKRGRFDVLDLRPPIPPLPTRTGGPRVYPGRLTQSGSKDSFLSFPKRPSRSTHSSSFRWVSTPFLAGLNSRVGWSLC